jgi:hypothetical protein
MPISTHKHNKEGHLVAICADWTRQRELDLIMKADWTNRHTPGEVKKVLESLWFVVISLISVVTLMSLPTTGGIRQKPREKTHTHKHRDKEREREISGKPLIIVISFSFF